MPADANAPNASLGRALSAHFTLGEFCVSQAATRLGLANVPTLVEVGNLKRVAAALERVRAAVGNKPITITSGFRSLAVNRAVGSHDGSAHVHGLAVDFVCPGYGKPTNLCEAVIQSGIEFDQLIDEGGWVHLGLAAQGADVRGDVLTARFVAGQPTRYVRGVGSGIKP